MRHAEIEKAINVRRKKLNRDILDASASKVGEELPTKTYPESDGSDLVGLALSGGGIRSAMFNLGLMQSMQRSGFLKHVDYISSVSGGGYTNGYYSTLGHHDATASKEENHGLAAKDAQFLLDGQYLNRPTEFMTDYLLKTALVFGTVFASVIFLASIIAIYFRVFDYPSVRRWLGLLDVNSDLRVGIFASVLLILAVLLVRGGYRSLQRTFRATPTPAPGRWAVIAIGILLLGCAVMIGNGDFFVSDQLGFLPEKIDLKSLQLPIAVIVAILFFPLLRIGSLVRSERITASLWQRMALWIILSGATWGAFFVSVGFLGQENLSGVVTERPPTFLKEDIFYYDRLANLALDGEFGKLLEKKCQIANETSSEYKSIIKLTARILAEAKQKNDAERKLRQDDYLWDTWLNFKTSTLQRWTATVLGRMGCDNDARTYVEADYTLNECDGPRLLAKINYAIEPDNLSKSIADSNVATPSDIDLDLTNLLLVRAARKVVLRTENIPDQVREKFFEGKSASKDSLNNGTTPEDDRTPDGKEEVVRCAIEALNRWVAQGAPMARRVSSDPTGFRDSTDLKTILEVLAPTWTNHATLVNTTDLARKDNEKKNSNRLITQLNPLQHWKLNRLLLEIAYPEIFKERRWISTSVTIAEDQRFRWTIMIVSGIVALLGILKIDINLLSPWFQFYRKRVHETFLRKAGQTDENERLHELKPWEKGYPYPLFVGGLLLPHAPTYRRIQSARNDGETPNPNSNINPSKVDGSFGSLWYSFLMSPLHVGWMQATTDAELLKQKTYRCTEEYLNGELTVSDAIVLSGAAVSTFMASNPALRILMQVFNIRLEQWLPNPIKCHHKKHHSLLFSGTKYVRFNTFDIYQELRRSMRWTTQEFKADSWGYGVVADGGFREFLGVEELVARRCKIIVASDAGCNNGLYEFGVLADLIRKLRLDHDVELLDLDHDKPLDTKRLVRMGSENSHSPQHYIVGRIKYPKSKPEADSESPDSMRTPDEGLFIYVQMSLTGDEDIDIAQFKKTNPQFPDEPISNQFYSKDQVESFRQLGEHIGKLLCWDIDEFDCPLADECESRKWRIEALDHAFREAYRSECRQESVVATDDVRIGWMFDGPQPDKNVADIIEKFESSASTDHQILIRNFVWHCVEGYDDKKHAPTDPYFDFKQLQAADLYGIAIESNRRHSGFRPEWPTAFFQINGRDLLRRATQRAHLLLQESMMLNKSVAERLNPFEEEAQSLIAEFSRFAVMLPRAVFRLEGVRTATDVLVCLINLGLQMRPISDGLQHDTQTANLLLLHLRSEPVQKKLRRAVQTGNPLEVESVLTKILSDFFLVRLERLNLDDSNEARNPKEFESNSIPNYPR